MPIRRIRSALLLAALAFAACCSLGGSYERLGVARDQLAPTGAFARLVVDLRTGSLVVRESEQPEVDVQAEVLVRGALAERHQDELGKDPALAARDWFALTQSGDTVTL